MCSTWLIARLVSYVGHAYGRSGFGRIYHGVTSRTQLDVGTIALFRCTSSSHSRMARGSIADTENMVFILKLETEAA
jgi:hypothetical protein